MKTVAVRELVGLVLRRGDLDLRMGSGDRTEEGNEVHRLLQGDYGDHWEKEVHFKKTFESLGLAFQGRADGVYHKEMIHEIKSTRRKLSEWDSEGHEEHWAQAYCYALVLAEREDLECVDVLLTYYNLKTEERRDFKRQKTRKQLLDYVTSLMEAYAEWYEMQRLWIERRSTSLKDLGFPYERYREGQRRLAAAVYTAMRDGFLMMAEAPTGVGKTVSTLFPSLKAMGEGALDKIFYCTAKTVARTVAEEALIHIRRRGACVKSVTLTAKDKICFTGEKQCYPEACTYARGHYDRLSDALKDAFHTEDHMDREQVIAFAEKHHICPFEFSFDLASLSDVVIADYNYVFDPLVQLQRFFAEVTERYAFLVDEGHNMPGRAREMFSAEVRREDVIQLRKAFPAKSAPYKELGKLSKTLQVVKKELQEEALTYRVSELPASKICGQVRKAFETAATYIADTEHFELPKEEGEILAGFYRFDHLSELFGEGHVWLESIDGDGLGRLMCIDPSELLAEAYKKSVGTVIFSATMAPYDYYDEILGLQGCKKLLLDSPFPKENRALLLGAGVDTRLRGREMSYGRIAAYIEALVTTKVANYLVFFPSYEFLRTIQAHLETALLEKGIDYRIVPQTQGMSEAEKVGFLSEFEFEGNSIVIGMAVLGGSFSEGIDLVGSRLEGVVLVGFGTPYVSAENTIIQSYYEDHGKDGYTYAFVYPSINKVVQAVGRLIRTETDRGVVLLLDDRYVSSHYKRWLPQSWEIQRLQTPERVSQFHKDFWQC